MVPCHSCISKRAFLNGRLYLQDKVYLGGGVQGIRAPTFHKFLCNVPNCSLESSHFFLRGSLEGVCPHILKASFVAANKLRQVSYVVFCSQNASCDEKRK